VEAIERAVRVDGRLFRVEALLDAARGVWHAVVGEGREPRRWTRLPLSYDTADEALAAAVGGVVRLVGRPGRDRSVTDPAIARPRGAAGPRPRRPGRGQRPRRLPDAVLTVSGQLTFANNVELGVGGAGQAAKK
jgi:hypothetical protein